MSKPGLLRRVESIGPAAAGVPFADLSRQWRAIAHKVRDELDHLFETSAFSHGPYVERFEAAAARYLDVAHAVAVNSGTSALHLALIASGIGPGDKVIVPAHTFIATVWPVLYVGAQPILCDVDPETGTIDIADARRRLEPGTRAVIPVHLYGQPADMEAVTSFAEHHGLIVIEDAAQAFGAKVNGRAIGAFGRFGCFSFYPGKNLGAAGEAGLIVTDNEGLADRLRRLRNHGQRERYIHEEVGFNYRMDGLQGLVLGHKLSLLDSWTGERRAIAERFCKELAGTPLLLPTVRNGDHVWHLFVVRSTERDALRAHLGEAGIETGLHYPLALHEQPCLAHLALDPKSLPAARDFAQTCLSLPIFAGMTSQEIDRVVGAVRGFFDLKA